MKRKNYGKSFVVCVVFLCVCVCACALFPHASRGFILAFSCCAGQVVKQRGPDEADFRVNGQLPNIEKHREREKRRDRGRKSEHCSSDSSAVVLCTQRGGAENSDLQ